MEDKATLRELRERYFIDRRWKDVVDVLEREIPLTEDREERLDLYEELGTVSVERLQDADRAFEAFRVVSDLRDGFSEADALEAFEQILAFAPGYYPAFQRVEAVLRSRGDAASFEALASRYIDLAAALVNEPDRFLRHQREAARIFEQELHEPGSALVVLVASVSTETWHTGILDDIERLAGQLSTWDEPIDRLVEVVGNMTDGEPAGRLHRRIGFWCLQGGRHEEASYHLGENLRHFPADGEAQDAVSGLYRIDGRWDDLVETARRRYQAATTDHARREQRDRLRGALEEAAEAALIGSEKARFLAELGHFLDREYDDKVTAVSVWEQALNAEPETLEAARPLIDYYLERNRWERAAPVLESVVKIAQQQRGAMEPHEENLRWLQYADVLDRVGNDKLALHAYRQAYEIDRNNARTLERLGLLLYEAEEFDQAYHVFVQLADRHEREISPELAIEVLRKAAAIKTQHGDLRVARGLLERALRIAPNDRESLKLAADVATAEGSLDEAMRVRKRLNDSESNPTVKFKDLVDMGDTWGEANDWEQAARSYVNALEVDPKSVSVLRKLLAAFQKIGRWREAIGVLERLAAQENDRIKRAKLWYTMGIVARDEVGSPERAVGYFEQALDDDLELLKAFEAIDRIFTGERMWKELERAYRRMLHRVTENELGLSVDVREKLEKLLWRNLGEVYRSRLGDYTSAAKAFETLLSFDEDDEAVQLIVTELYEKAGINTGGAVEQHRKLLAKDPMRADSQHGLFRAFMVSKQYDAAHCVAGALSWLQRGDSESEEYYQTYLGHHLKLAQSAFYPELLDRVYPRKQNRVVNGVMAHLAVVLRANFANSHKDFGVSPKTDRIDETNSPLMFAQMYRYVTKTLAMQPPPHLFGRRDHPLGLRILNVEPPAMLIGSDIIGGFDDDRSMVFRLGKLVAWMRPEHYLAAIGNQPGQLHVMFVSAMDWVLGRKPTAGRDGASIIKALKSAPSGSQMQIQTLMRTYLRHASEPPDMGQWVTQAEMATSRFGLVLCGEFAVAAKHVKEDPPVMTEATTQDRIVDLVTFGMSDEYVSLRKELKLGIH